MQVTGTAETHVRQLPHMPDEQGLLLGWEVWLLICPLSEVAPTPISPVEVCCNKLTSHSGMQNAHGDQDCGGSVYVSLNISLNTPSVSVNV